jgi:NitT/TauT family transport system ATP-binding protein
MSARLSFRNLSRAFAGEGGQSPVLDGVSMVLEPGSFTALVGPSGSGKSTLLHIAAGLDTEFVGDFQIEPATPALAYMSQQPRLLPWKAARENVALVLEAHGVSRRLASERALDMLARVGMAASADVMPQRLSGGMQQRVALARALVIDPDVLLMDEPFSALDEISADRLRTELLTLWMEKQRTVLMVTHNIREACEMADRIVVLSHRPGRIVADFTVDLPRPRRRNDLALNALAHLVLGAVEPSAVAGAPVEGMA